MSYDNLSKDTNAEEDKDQINNYGGPMDSDIHTIVIDLVYLDKTPSGSTSFTITGKTLEGVEFKNTQYITSGDKKGNKNTYETQTGELKYLPGFTVADHICLLAFGKPIDFLAKASKKKAIKVYDSKEKKEVLKEKDVITQLKDKKITLGILKVLVDKKEAGSNGTYKPTGKSMLVNEISKVFRTKDHLTVIEVRQKAENPEFFEKWVEKFKGKEIDKMSKEGKKLAEKLAKETKSSNYDEIEDSDVDDSDDDDDDLFND